MNLFDRTITRRHQILLALILLLGYGARFLTATHTYCVSTDSIYFLEIADRMGPLTAEALWAGVDHHPFHPLYPLLMAVTRAVFGGELVWAGQIVSVIFGTLVLIPLFFIVRNVFGTVPALCSAALFAVNPEHLEASGDVMSEATFLFFVITAAALAIPAWVRRSWPAGLGAGAAAAFAYLVRPEGGAPMLVLAIALGLGLRHERKRTAACLAAALLGFAVIAAPYIWHISWIDGTFKPEITMKKPIWDHPVQNETPIVAAAKPPAPAVSKPFADTATSRPQKAKNAPYIAYKIIVEYLESIFFISLAGVAFGIPASIVHRRRMGPGTPLVLGLMGLTVFVGVILFLAVEYLSSRHIIALTALTFAWAGYGTAWAACWLGRYLPRIAPPTRVALVIVLLIAIHVPKIAKPQRWDQLGAKKMGQIITEMSREPEVFGPEDYVITNVKKALFYGGLEGTNGIRVEFSKWLTYDEVIATAKRAAARGRHARLLLVPYKDGYQEFIDAGEYDRLELIYIFGQEQLESEFKIRRKLKDKRKMYLYRVPEVDGGP